MECEGFSAESRWDQIYVFARALLRDGGGRIANFLGKSEKDLRVDSADKKVQSDKDLRWSCASAGGLRTH